METGKRVEAETENRVGKHYSSGSRVVNGTEKVLRIILIFFGFFLLCEMEIRNGIGM